MYSTSCSWDKPNFLRTRLTDSGGLVGILEKKVNEDTPSDGVFIHCQIIARVISHSLWKLNFLKSLSDWSDIAYFTDKPMCLLVGASPFVSTTLPITLASSTSGCRNSAARSVPLVNSTSSCAPDDSTNLDPYFYNSFSQQIGTAY